MWVNSKNEHGECNRVRIKITFFRFVSQCWNEYVFSSFLQELKIARRLSKSNRQWMPGPLNGEGSMPGSFKSKPRNDEVSKREVDPIDFNDQKKGPQALQAPPGRFSAGQEVRFWTWYTFIPDLTPTHTTYTLKYVGGWLKYCGGNYCIQNYLKWDLKNLHRAGCTNIYLPSDAHAVHGYFTSMHGVFPVQLFLWFHAQNSPHRGWGRIGY